MKILIVRMWPDELDIKNYNCQEIGLAKALVEKGNVCDIVLYTSKKESYEEEIKLKDEKKIHIYYLRAKVILKNAIYEKKLYEIIKNYDIIQTAEYDQIGNVKLQKKTNGRMIIYHGPYASKYTKGYNIKCIISDIYYLFNKKYKNTICITKSELATIFLKKKGFKNVTTVGVGLDYERIKREEKVLKNENLKKQHYILYIGKIEDRRNILFLLKLVKNITKKRKDIKLIIVGNGKKKYVKKCKKYIEKNKIKNYIEYYKKIPQNDLQYIYKKSSVFVLPTKYEIFGMVILEAMFFGLPVVTTLNGGSSTLIDNEKNGFIKEFNVKEWEKSIIDIIDNEDYKAKIGTEARKKIVNEYTWKVLSKKFIKKYNEAINNIN